MVFSEKADYINQTIKECRRCSAYSDNGALCMNNKEIGLSYSYPQSTPIEIMFVAESPPAPGKGFFYDDTSINIAFKKKLFKLINKSGIGVVKSLEDFSNNGFYMADAINCRWDKTKKKNLPKAIFNNCSYHLAEQINLFKPKYIVAMGANAQKSIKLDKPRLVIENLGIPDKNIIEISFILVAANETDDQRISKLKKIIAN